MTTASKHFHHARSGTSIYGAARSAFLMLEARFPRIAGGTMGQTRHDIEWRSMCCYRVDMRGAKSQSAWLVASRRQGGLLPPDFSAGRERPGRSRSRGPSRQTASFLDRRSSRRKESQRSRARKAPRPRAEAGAY